MNSFLRYVRTILHFRPRQLLALIRNRLLPPPTDLRPILGLSLRARVGINPGLSPLFKSDTDYSFRFLNQGKTFPVGCIEWASKDMPKLWRYNLHYFDYLFTA